MTGDNGIKDNKRLLFTNFSATYKTDFELQYHLEGKLYFVQFSTLGLKLYNT